jgi:Flp pilus assembly CpaE family ATPase
MNLPRLRLALALGDQEREARLRPMLDADDEFGVVAQCLAADQLMAVIEAGGADAAVIAWGLHRLTDSALGQIERSRVPFVLLVPDVEAVRWQDLRALVLPLDADAASVRQSLHAALRGERWAPTRAQPGVAPVGAAAQGESSPAGLSIIAVTGGSGSPGRTTVAINLAAALGCVAPTVLVDADLDGPSIAAYLDRDPSRNVCTLAHAVRESPHAWSAVLADELQPLDRPSGLGLVLCGPPKREMRSSVSPLLLERLIRELAQRHRYVVLDVGAELLGNGPAAGAHRAALAAAQHTLVVAAADLVGLWHARTSLRQLEHTLEIDPQRVSLVINRHEPRYHHTRAEIEWHLGARAAAVVPYDYAHVQRAIAEQRPLLTDRASRAGRALLGLAERIHAGRVRLPEERKQPDSVGARLSRALRLSGPRARSSPGTPSSRGLATVVSSRDRSEAW